MFNSNAVSFYVVLQIVELVLNYAAAKVTDVALGFAIRHPVLYRVFCQSYLVLFQNMVAERLR